MNQRPYFIVTALIAGFVIALAAGCRPAPESGTTLTWATNLHASRHDAARWFEQENPGVKVRLMPISEPRQFFLQCIYGDAPDVITFFSADTFQTFAGNGLLKPLKKEGTDPWPYYDALKDYCFHRKTGELMALPQVAYPYVLYFNPALVPPGRAVEADTWESLFSLIQEIGAGRTPEGKAIFGLDIQNETIWFTTWYGQRGGRLFSREGKSIVDRQIARETLEAMDQWRRVQGLLPRPSDRLNLPSKGASQGVLGSLFLQGRAMFYWSGSWKISDFENQDRVPWQVRSLPRGPANNMTIMGGNSFGIASRARHPETAEKFIAYLAKETAQTRHQAHQIYLPAHKSVPVPDQVLVVKKQALSARCPEHSPLLNEAMVKEIFKIVLESHRLGLADADAAAAMLADALASGMPEVCRD